jgi:hypothetical protein
MKIVINLFLPVRRFLEVNLTTLEGILDQWSSSGRHRITVAGYVESSHLPSVRSLLDRFPPVDLEVTSCYEQIKSKCHLLNRHLSREALREGVFYCEYDLTVPDLTGRLDGCQDLYAALSRPLFLGFNHSSHQLTVYETSRPVQLSSGETATLVRPFDPRCLAMGTGCFFVRIPENASLAADISCPSYGYGRDDQHLSAWLLANGFEMAVVAEWWVEHRAVRWSPFEEWKRAVIRDDRHLTQQEYQQFWESQKSDEDFVA